LREINFRYRSGKSETDRRLSTWALSFSDFAAPDLFANSGVTGERIGNRHEITSSFSRIAKQFFRDRSDSMFGGFAVILRATCSKVDNENGLQSKAASITETLIAMSDRITDTRS
jgi:hypothetical protein